METNFYYQVVIEDKKTGFIIGYGNCYRNKKNALKQAEYLNELMKKNNMKEKTIVISREFSD